MARKARRRDGGSVIQRGIVIQMEVLYIEDESEVVIHEQTDSVEDSGRSNGRD